MSSAKFAAALIAQLKDRHWGEARLDIFRQNSGYGLGPIALEKVLQDWRDDGGLKGLSFS